MIPTDTEKKIIELISVDIENMIHDITKRHDIEMMRLEESALYYNESLEAQRERIGNNYCIEYTNYVKSIWDSLSYEEQIIFALYYMEQDQLLEWMDECQISAMRLMR